MLRRARTYLIGLGGAAVAAAVTTVVTGLVQAGTDRIISGPPAASPSVSATAAAGPFRVTIGTATASSVAFADRLDSVSDADTLANGFDTDAAFDAFVAERHGAYVGTDDLTMVFTGTASGPVRIVRMSIAAKTAGPILRGTLVNPFSAGEVSTIHVSANLDSASSAVLGADGTPYSETHAIEIQPEEHVTVGASIGGDKASYTWVIAIEYVDAAGADHVAYFGRDGVLYDDPGRIADADRFAMTAGSKTYGLIYDDNYPAAGYHASAGSK
jgi:hypothetical protein